MTNEHIIRALEQFRANYDKYILNGEYIEIPNYLRKDETLGVLKDLCEALRDSIRDNPEFVLDINNVSDFYIDQYVITYGMALQWLSNYPSADEYMSAVINEEIYAYKANEYDFDEHVFVAYRYRLHVGINNIVRIILANYKEQEIQTRVIKRLEA